VIEAPSPNRGERRGGARPDLVVLHTRHGERRGGAGAAVRSGGGGVVPLSDRRGRASLAAGAGGGAGVACRRGAWGAVGDVNSRSIGIELANPGRSRAFRPSRAAQMAVLEALLDGDARAVVHRARRVIAHSDMAPGRKADPGPKFDWRRLARAGSRSGMSHGRGGRLPGCAFRRRRGAIGYGPGAAAGRRCSRRSGCGSVPAPRGARGPRTSRWRGGRGRAAARLSDERPSLSALDAGTCGHHISGSDARTAGRPRGRTPEESPDSGEEWRRVTPARGNPRESATENSLPDASGRPSGEG
jgi:N-acetylmuramoyl-L-alanine amidase